MPSQHHRVPVRTPPHGRPPAAGFTLVELTISMAVLLVAVSMLSGTVSSLARQNSINRENTIATNAARVVIERMRGAEFAQVFALYNADPTDDPPGGAPGHRFAVAELDPVAGSPDGLVGEVSFPALVVGEQGGAPLQELREDAPNEDLGLPRDLSGDSIVDEDDHAGDYVILPVLVRLRWSGRSGEREYTTTTTLCRFHR